MKRLIPIIILFALLLASPCHAFGPAIQAVLSAGGAAACTPTTITQDTGAYTEGLSGNIIGQGFTMSGTKLVSIEIPFNSVSGSPTVECRIGTSRNLGTYIASVTSGTLSNATYTFTFNTTGLTDGGQYYFGLDLVSGTEAKITGVTPSAYAGTDNSYTSSASPTNWNMASPVTTYDLKFTINGCQ